MGLPGPTRRTVRLLAGLAVSCLGVSLAALPAHRQRTPWEQAVAARSALVASPSRAAFAAVLDRFRAIYHDAPHDPHAPDAINAVAELLTEQGRSLPDAKALRDAVGQYEFLRAQYPGSPLRTPALLAEARLERDDLQDATAARRLFTLLLREAPHSPSAAAARTELAALAARPAPAAETRAAANRTLPAADRSPVPGAGEARADLASSVPAVAAASPASGGSTHGPLISRAATPDAAAAAQPGKANASQHAPAEVTGIRHWSTPTYTRVAIDLGDEVTFDAARVPHPDRIFFDLHGAELAAALVGKSFEVTDDGFLKRIRAAQAGPGTTRVVLDVNDVAEYSAFLLPNPYRLIIDIHGARESTAAHHPQPAPTPESAAATTPLPPAAQTEASARANSSGLPPTAPTDGGEAVRPVPPSTRAALPAHAPEPARDANTASVPAPRTGTLVRPTAARPVPNTVAVKSPASATDVAALGDAPGRMDATALPAAPPAPRTHTPPTPDAAPPRTPASGIAAVTAGTLPRATAPPAKKRRAPLADAAAGDPTAAPARAADKTADGETSLVRALGLRIGRIVIDAGHGGHDSGTLGADGIQEKDVVLDVALRLGKLLHERLGAEVIYTRSDDTFIPLETRTAIANKAQADLFLSIHANSSPDPTARGVETYYLNFTSDPTALDVAARENAVGGQGVHQLSDLVKKIALKDKIAESREFASDVEASLFAGLERGNEGLRNRGVKKAPFVVLIGANMPSILAEISFVTNPRDATELRLPDYRQRVAESLFAGVARYQHGLAGSRPGVDEARASAQ